jgi:hypothetical protein
LCLDYNLNYQSIEISLPKTDHSLDSYDVYYGMADKRIGIARLDLPKTLPPEGIAEKIDTTL